MLAALQTGSKLARSASGTRRSACAAARWEIAGMARPPAVASAPAPITDFRNVRRSMMGLNLVGRSNPDNFPLKYCKAVSPFSITLTLGVSLPGLTGQSSIHGRWLLDRPVKPGDDSTGQVKLVVKWSRSHLVIALRATLTLGVSLPGLTGQSSVHGRWLLDRPVKPGDDSTGA